MSDKGLFLVVIILTGFILIGLLFVAYFVPSVGLEALPPLLKWGFESVIILASLFFVFTLGYLGIAVVRGKDASLPFSKKLRTIAIKYLLPLFIITGRLGGISKERIQHAFVAVNNELVMSYCKNGNLPRKILLLMPHCLQYSECPIKITHNVRNCKKCGKCPIKNLVEFTERYDVFLSVATGGTIARRIVKEIKPDLIIAVACERDLTSGIQDTVPLPVYGIFNRRPFGPCFNTQVDVEAIEKVLRELRPKRLEADES